jgi:hypothetical protein
MLLNRKVCWGKLVALVEEPPMAFEVFAPSVSRRTKSDLDDEPPLEGPYLFYRSSGSDVAEELLGDAYVASLWRPSLVPSWPSGAPELKIKLRFLFRAALYHLRFFSRPECGAVCVHLNGILVHYSLFSARYWRFPFLADADTGPALKMVASPQLERRAGDSCCLEQPRRQVRFLRAVIEMRSQLRSSLTCGSSA